MEMEIPNQTHNCDNLTCNMHSLSLLVLLYCRAGEYPSACLCVCVHHFDNLGLAGVPAVILEEELW